MSNSVKELVNAFNLNNYAIDKVNTNFTVEDKKKKIVGLFASDTNVEEYLREVGEKVIKLHYRTREAASEYYNLRCFPFVLGTNADKRYLGKGVMAVELADSANKEVIRNLKLHFVNEFERVIGFQVIASLREEGVTEEEARKWAEGTIQVGAISRSLPYLCCIAFSDEYFKREEYDSETFELFKGVYIQEFNSRLRKCGLKNSDFYEYRNGMLYIKDVSDKVVKNVTEYVKKEIAFDFRTPGSVESKVENCKNVLNDLIFKFTGKLIYGYDYDVFTDAKKIKYGNSFALIPFIEVNGQLQSLSKEDVGKINSKLGDVISDIRGKTENPQFANCKEPVYAIYNKRITQLLPRIMESPIAYNRDFERFEFAVNLENLGNRQRAFSPNPGSDVEDSPSSSLNKTDSPIRFPNRSPSLSEVNGSVRNEPGYRDSVASKGSEFSKRSSGYYSESASSVADAEPSAGPSTRPSDENWFFRDSPRVSSMSSSSTSDSISSNASVGTVLSGKGGLPHFKAQLTGPAGFPAARCTKAMKGVPTAVDSFKCSVHGLSAVTGTAKFVPVSVSHVKPVGFEYLRHDESTIKKFLANGEREWGRSGQSEHRWQDEEKRRSSTKQATKERVY